jgi:HEAT repeat protein
MNTGRIYLVMLILAVCCAQVCLGQNKPPSPANGAAPKVELDPQLEVNRKALLTGDVGAASIMLFHEDPNARRILLETLTQGQNSPARIAVCQALNRTRTENKAVKNVEEFIGPLLVVFGSENPDEVRWAAEVTLIFEYGQIEQPLEELLADASKPIGARVNAVHALTLRLLDMEATIKLITLVDHPDPSVAAKAEQALRSLGIEVGENAEARNQMRKRIAEQGTESFLRNRLIHVQSQKRRVAAELDSLEKSYMALLARAYRDMSDDAKKGTFLAEHLGSSKAPVKLWALEEADQWRKGTNNDNFPRKQLEPILIGLIADSDRDVRLRTADLLAVMGELTFARPLLSQLEAEQDAEVETKLFVALGWACSSAISSSVPANLSAEIKAIRADTLKWAEKFLSEKDDAEKVCNGAEVIEKLLKRDGLEDAEVKKYLDLLLARYEQQKGNSGGTLTGELLSAMAGLCTQNSSCSGKAAELYWPLFEEALRSETAFVRETAADGLANIDKTRALGILRDRFVNDPSVNLRKKIIALANEAGDKRDLEWLSEKIGVNSESKPAWQAMNNIFKGCDAETVNGWVEKLTAENSTKLNDQQKIAFLIGAVEKAENENKPQMLKAQRVRLAAFYRKTNQYEKAEECLDKLRSMATTPEQKTQAVADLLDLYFAWPKTDLAAKLLAAALEAEDLDANGVLLKTLDDHLTKPTKGVDPKEVVAQLAAIKAPENRAKWVEWLKGWQTRLSKAEQPAEKPKTPDT